MPRAPPRDPTSAGAGGPGLPSGTKDGRWDLGPAQAAAEAYLDEWFRTDAVGRIWSKDPTFWPGTRAPADGLGWLEAPERSSVLLAELREFGREVAEDGIEQVVLLGMGGSSLAPEVVERIFPPAQGRPDLAILDSTHPAAVRTYLDKAPLDRTLFLVSSKSGTTLEPSTFLRFFWPRVSGTSASPGGHFVAITDPGTPLERIARERRFRRCFLAPADVGGRYSALTVFCLVPAALLGVDLEGLVRTGRAMAARCKEPADGPRNPGLRLGAALGALARAGRDKVVFLPSRTLGPFPAWIEQLVAESLGKEGRGIVPVATTPPATELPGGRDVAFVDLRIEGEGDPVLDRELETRRTGGAPVLRFELPAPLDLGGEFFRWEFAVAACAPLLGVDPFNQPDVESSKELARRAVDAAASSGARPPAYGAPVDRGLRALLEGWVGSARPDDYVSVQAFLAPNRRTDAALGRLASSLRQRLGTVVTVDYGPRFLHSTGQLHKGGPASGLFLQLVDEPTRDLEVPDLGVTFGAILRAQAEADRLSLERRHRRIVVVNVGPRPVDGLRRIAESLGSPSRRAAAG